MPCCFRGTTAQQYPLLTNIQTWLKRQIFSSAFLSTSWFHLHLFFPCFTGFPLYSFICTQPVSMSVLYTSSFWSRSACTMSKLSVSSDHVCDCFWLCMSIFTLYVQCPWLPWKVLLKYNLDLWTPSLGLLAPLCSPGSSSGCLLSASVHQCSLFWSFIMSHPGREHWLAVGP